MKRAGYALALLVALAACNSEPALLRQTRKEELVEAMRDSFLESVDAEKSAVLSESDEESAALAHDSQTLAANVDQLRGELQALIAIDGRPAEVEGLANFDTTWAKLEEVDHRLLKLAVSNTNLKAARMSSQEGAAALDRFVDTLAEMQRTATAPDTIRALSSAEVAALRKQALLVIHIPTSDDAQMTRLEQQMSALQDKVDLEVAAVRQSGAVSPQQLAAAIANWTEYQRIADEVVRLSRENSNVRSFDVSIHEKRAATKDCLSALAKLEAAIESRPQPAR